MYLRLWSLFISVKYVCTGACVYACVRVCMYVCMCVCDCQGQIRQILTDEANVRNI